MAVPYACLQRRSIMKKVVTQSASSWSGMREIWSSSVPFRFFAVATHFYSAAFALTLSGLPFYLEVALGYTPDQVEVAMRVILIGAGIMIPISLPLVNFASQRIDPSKLAGFAGLLCIIISICHVHASFGIKDKFWLKGGDKFWLQVAQLSLICGAGVGALSVSWVSAQSALFTYIVDDDQVRQAERDGVLDRQEVGIDELPARRDGLINSFKSCFSISGAAWAGVLQLLLGILGYDGENYSNAKPQPEQVRIMMECVFILVIPSMFVIFAISMLCFPLRGARLLLLKSKYTQLYHMLSARPENKWGAHTRVTDATTGTTRNHIPVRPL